MILQIELNEGMLSISESVKLFKYWPDFECAEDDTKMDYIGYTGVWGPKTQLFFRCKTCNKIRIAEPYNY